MSSTSNISNLWTIKRYPSGFCTFSQDIVRNWQCRTKLVVSKGTSSRCLMSNELTRSSCTHAYIVCRISDRRSGSTRDHSSQLAAIQVPFYHPDKPAFHSSDQHGTRRPADNYFPIMIDNPPARYAFRFTRPASYLSPVNVVSRVC